MKAIYAGLAALPLLSFGAFAQSAVPVVPGSAGARPGATMQSAPATPEFVQKAMASNQFEIDTSNLALKQASDKKVKSFAQKMVKDHTNAGKKMMAALKAAKVDAPSAPQYDTQQQQAMSQLQAAQGPDFDRQYLAVQTTAHQNAVSLFQAYSGGGDNPALKKFASQTLPTLKSHLSMLEKMNR